MRYGPGPARRYDRCPQPHLRAAEPQRRDALEHDQVVQGAWTEGRAAGLDRALSLRRRAARGDPRRHHRASRREDRRRLARDDALAGGAPRGEAASRLCELQGRDDDQHRPELHDVHPSGCEARDPARGDRMGRRRQGRHPLARQSKAHRGGGRPVHELGRSRFRSRHQRRRARLSPAHPRLARDVQRRHRRRAGQPRLLHSVRLGHSLRGPGRRPGEAVHFRVLGLPLPLQQADVRPRNEVLVEPVHRAACRRRADRIGHHIEDATCGHHLLGRVEEARAQDQGSLARHGLQARLCAGCRLRALFRIRQADVPDPRRRKGVEGQGLRVRAARPGA